jgi:hypothetical protein
VIIDQALLDPYIEQLFWQQLATAKPRPKSRTLAKLEGVADRRESELVSYRDNPHLPVTLGDRRFAEGVAVRQRRAERARMELTQARHTTSPPALPSCSELKAGWASMSLADRRAAIAELIDCVFVWRGSRSALETRTCVLPRGQGPIGLPNVGQSHRQPLPSFEPPPSTGLGLRATGEWSRQRVYAELVEFLTGVDRWPNFQEFQASGRGLLHQQVKRHGGLLRWAGIMELPFTTASPNREKWTDARIRAGLLVALRGKQDWPTTRHFERAGHGLLRDAVTATGGPARWAREMGINLPAGQRTPERLWTDTRIKEEVLRLAAGKKQWPGSKKFQDAGLGGLYQTITRNHARERIATELGLSARSIHKRRTSRWTAERIRAALDDFLPQYTRWPTRREFAAVGLAGLRTRMSVDRTDDWWAAQYGMVVRRRAKTRSGTS